MTKESVQRVNDVRTIMAAAVDLYNHDFPSLTKIEVLIAIEQIRYALTEDVLISRGWSKVNPMNKPPEKA